MDGPWDDRNPALGQLADGTIVHSLDNGKTWEKPVKTPLQGMGASPYRKIVQLPDGTALVNVVQDVGGQKT